MDICHVSLLKLRGDPSKMWMARSTNSSYEMEKNNNNKYPCLVFFLFLFVLFFYFYLPCMTILLPNVTRLFDNLAIFNEKHSWKL